MSALAEKLKTRRRETQDTNHYSSSSRWYEALSKAISAIEQADVAGDGVDRFTKAYWAADGLSQLHAERGDEDIVAFQRWIEDIKTAPDVTSQFTLERALIPLRAFRDAVGRARNTILKRDGLQQLEAWRDNTPPAKACGYFFTICRAIRNRLFHADLNLNNASVKKVLGLGADCLIPVVAAAAFRCIEWPPEGTTGRAPAYRFFLYPFLRNSDGFFSDYYLERLFPDHELAAFPEDQAKELLKQIAKQLEAREPTLRTANAAETLANWLKPVLFEVLGTEPVSGVRIIGEEAVFEPTFIVPKTGASPREYHGELRGKAGANSLSCLIWTLPWHASLDSVATDPAFAALPVTEVVHRALATSDVPWAIITNGRQLRLLSRTTSHRPRCFLEADLVALIDRKSDVQAQRAFRFTLGLFSSRSFTEIDQAGHSLVDRVAQGSDRHGKEIGDELKSNVFSALEELGEGFLAYMRANPKITDQWKQGKAPRLSMEQFLTSDPLLDDVYQESLSLMYRLLFLFYAESRELLPLDNELYQSYSLESIRDDVHSVHDDPDPRRFFAKGSTDLWNRLKELFGFLDQGWGKVIPPYNGGLFDPEKHRFLEIFRVGDYHLARAIDLLSRTKPRSGQNRGEGRKKVTYRDLDVRHLGSIYEGILEFTAHISATDYVILRQGSGASRTEEYKAVGDLDRAEKTQLTEWHAAVADNPENPRLPRTCKIAGYVESGRYYLVFGGRESKRKSSGSYYTPDYIVQYIIESTLGPLVRGECRHRLPRPNGQQSVAHKEAEFRGSGPLGPEELLSLKILDPAMGSGHFLVAATEYLARAYRDACLREKRGTEGTQTDEEFVRQKRIIAERCIYGVDANPMAVELAKLSMWLFTMDPGRPLSFLDYKFRSGNSLVGASIDDLGRDPATFGRTIDFGSNHQVSLFEQHFSKTLPPMLKEIFFLLDHETATTQDIATKKTLFEQINAIRFPFRLLSNIWTAAFFDQSADYSNFPTLMLHIDNLPKIDEPAVAEEMKFFPWEIEFPEAYFDRSGSWQQQPGFDCIVGNPPWGGAYKSRLTEWLIARFAPFHRRTPELANYFVAAVSAMLLRKGGLFGLILPSVLFQQHEFALTRRYLTGSGAPLEFINLGDGIFEGVTAPCGILVWRKGPRARNFPASDLRGVDRESLPDELATLVKTASRQISVDELLSLEDAPFVCDPDELRFSVLAHSRGTELGTWVEEIGRGITTGGDEAFRITTEAAQSQFGALPFLKPVLKGGEITEYSIPKDTDHVIIYSTKDTDVSRYPKVLKHLEKYKVTLAAKRETVQGKLPWYCLHWPRYPGLFRAPKVVLRQTADTLIAGVDKYGYYTLDSVHNIHPAQSGAEISVLDLCALLVGILNSEPLRRQYRLFAQEEGRVFPQVKDAILRKLRMPKLGSEEKQLIINNVNAMEKLQKQRITLLVRKHSEGAESIHPRLLAMTPEENGELGQLTGVYLRYKTEIDRTVLRGFSV